MRIATWNVERVKPQGWKIAPAQRQHMTEVDADIWILTDRHNSFIGQVVRRSGGHLPHQC